MKNTVVMESLTMSLMNVKIVNLKIASQSKNGSERKINMECLKMPELNDYKFETEEDMMTDYAYDLRDYAESLEKCIDKIKSKNTENLEYVKEEIKEAFYLSETATELRNQFYKLWFANFTPTDFESTEMVNIMCEQLNVLWDLNGILSRLLSDLEGDFRFLQYRKNERKLNG